MSYKKLSLNEKKFICRWFRHNYGTPDYDGFIKPGFGLSEDIMQVYRKLFPKDWD